MIAPMLGCSTVRVFLGLLALVIASLILCLPAVAHAQWDPTKQFEEGLAKFDKGDYEGALPFFENVYSRTNSPNARLYLARCLAKLEQHAEAYRQMKGTVDLAGSKAESEPKYASTRDKAAAELIQLEKKVGKVIVAFSEPYNGAEAMVNGRTLDVDEHGKPQIVAPGEVEIVASAPGRQTFSKTISVEGGETQTVAVALGDDLGQVEDSGGGGLSTLQYVGIGVGALGVIGIVVFAITGAQTASDFSELEDECGGPCPNTPEYTQRIDDGKSMQTLANVMLIVGSVLTAGGLAMIIFGGDGDGDGSDDVSVEASIAPSPDGVGLSLSGNF